MGIHKMKVKPGSEGETYFIQLLEAVGVKPERVMCRLGSVFGTDYNEYGNRAYCDDHITDN